jgi:hypothetical protein
MDETSGERLLLTADSVVRCNTRTLSLAIIARGMNSVYSSSKTV